MFTITRLTIIPFLWNILTSGRRRRRRGFLLPVL